jgi:glycosyltransferase involved in cell wall biosynthesis
VAHRDRLVVFNQSAGYLMVDIINANSKSYKEVVLITGNFNPRQTPLQANARIKKVIRYNRNSALMRLFTWCVGYLQMCVYALWYQRGSHFIVVSNPPISFLIPMRWVHSYSLLVYDVYPNALVDYQYVKDTSLMVRIWKRANKRVYSQAKAIYTISDGMRSLLGEYTEAERIQVVPIWTDNQFLKPVPKTENIFLQRLRLRGKFIVQYSGNLGRTHNIEVLLEIAKRIQHDGIHFLIVGEGTQKEELQRKAGASNLTNVTFLPWQKTSMLPYSLSAADIGLVSLGTDASNLSVPSKTFNLMSVGVPVLCLTGKESELASLVRKYNFGKCVEPHDIELMVEFILSLYSNPQIRDSYSKNALNASIDFTPSNANLIQ